MENKMKYKVLLVGRNNMPVIDEFFNEMSETFECQSSSTYNDDILGHLRYFQPDILIYCLNDETRDRVASVTAIKPRLEKSDIPFAIIGDQQDCEDFARFTTMTADLVLVKPMNALTLQQRIVNHFNQQKLLKQVQGEQFTDESINKLLGIMPEENRKHILIIDDDARILKLLKNLLHDNYDVATAINGKTAYRFLENKSTDLILLDYAMPEEDGPAVLTHLRSNPATASIPVVFLTGVTDRDMITKVLKMKPQGYLLKPINRAKLFSTVKGIIG
jgi:response regulator RpfG family c-di-GMP phosphodiesterase